ncbi:hypothetical protein [Rubrivirga sp.]|uniref:hypothetical protein n=1 Tax=Rubrivirga sp. TaxID=1885344 RepID=UPI003C70E279
MRFILLACLLTTTAASAQPTTVDIDFVNGFFGVMGQSTTYMETVPDSLRPLLPDGAEVLGALVPSGTRGSFVSAVVRLETDAQDAAQAFRARGVPGWEITDAPESQGGFASGAQRFEVELSRGEIGAGLMFSARPRGPGSLAVIVAQPRQPERADWETESIRRHMPALDSPPGGRQQNEGGGGSSDHWTNRAFLQSDLGLEDVAAHYGSQMEAAGWTDVASTLKDERAIGVWIHTLEGEMLTATLDVILDSPGTYALRLMLVGTEQ